MKTKRLLSFLLALSLVLVTMGALAATLQNGSRGEDVKVLQTALRDRGYYSGRIDGIFGNQTEYAVRRFQSDHGLLVDGKAGPKTLAALGITTGTGVALSYGDKGERVKQLQMALFNKGFFKSTIDGIYGDSTWAAVWAFQRSVGLPATGVATLQTLSALGVSSSGGTVTTTLRYGDSGAAVVKLQDALKKAGFYSGALDGLYRDATWTAVWQFQRAKGLSADGVAGPQTLALLGLGTPEPVTPDPTQETLRYGSSGPGVTRLQNALKAKGYYSAAVDGIYRDSTWTAVWLFQRDNGLTPDGIAGPATLSKLYGSGTATPSPGPTAAPTAAPTSAPTPIPQITRTLRYGDQGADVLVLQTKLKDLGYFQGLLDGKFGDTTWTAVWKFQNANKLTADGIAGAQTLALLGLGKPVPITTSTPAPAVVTSTLRHGSKGYEVTLLQNALKAKGYFSGTPNGEFDDATWSAVWRFQRDNGLATDGIAGPKTLAKLGLAAVTTPAPFSITLKVGSKGEYVKQVQIALSNLGLYKGSIDSVYGESTWTAVWWFQTNNGLSATGNVDTTTWNKLIK